jgi:hypothetical protein
MTAQHTVDELANWLVLQPRESFVILSPSVTGTETLRIDRGKGGGWTVGPKDTVRSSSPKVKVRPREVDGYVQWHVEDVFGSLSEFKLHEDPSERKALKWALLHVLGMEDQKWT